MNAFVDWLIKNSLSCSLIAFALSIDLWPAVIALKRRSKPEGPAPISSLMLVPFLLYVIGGFFLRAGAFIKVSVVLLPVGLNIATLLFVRSARLQWQEGRRKIPDTGQGHEYPEA
ncbi:MAG TPA: hypothetical protein VGM23_10975 [Armatimonadota bacterium]|jgi:hypothetical protein